MIAILHALSEALSFGFMLEKVRFLILLIVNAMKIVKIPLQIYSKFFPYHDSHFPMLF